MGPKDIPNSGLHLSIMSTITIGEDVVTDFNNAAFLSSDRSKILSIPTILTDTANKIKLFLERDHNGRYSFSSNVRELFGPTIEALQSSWRLSALSGGSAPAYHSALEAISGFPSKDSSKVVPLGPILKAVGTEDEWSQPIGIAVEDLVPTLTTVRQAMLDVTKDEKTRQVGSMCFTCCLVPLTNTWSK